MPKTLKTRSGRKIVLPTAQENAVITAAASTDSDAMPMTGTQLENVRTSLRRGRPVAQVTKERITIRLSRDVVERFRATGDGWQTRVDAALKDWLRTHTPA